MWAYRQRPDRGCCIAEGARTGGDLDDSAEGRGPALRGEIGKRYRAGLRSAQRTPLRHCPSSIANEIVFEPRGLNRELRPLVHQKAGMTLLCSEVLGSFPEGLAPPAGTAAEVPADPGAGERLGCES